MTDQQRTQDPTSREGRATFSHRPSHAGTQTMSAQTRDFDARTTRAEEVGVVAGPWSQHAQRSRTGLSRAEVLDRLIIRARRQSADA